MKRISMLMPTVSTMRPLWIHSVFAVCVMISIQEVLAQNAITWRNKYAGVSINNTSGEIMRIVKYDPSSWLGPDSTDALWYSSPTSHVCLYFVNSNGDRNYFTNNSDPAYDLYDRSSKPPAIANGIKASSDTLSNDTIIVDFQFPNLGYDVKQYVYPINTNSSCSFAIEYRAVQTDVTKGCTLLGIMLELDLDVQSEAGIQAQCNGYNPGGDNAPILDTKELEEKEQGPCFIPVCAAYIGDTVVPQWFQVANSFEIDPNTEPIFLGNLRNPSVVSPGGGPLLTPPNEWYIGDMSSNGTTTAGLKNITWVVDTPDFQTGNLINDVGIIYKWNVTTPAVFRCCTSLGPNDLVNENYNCYNNAFWLNFRFPAAIAKDTSRESLPVDTIQLWVTNVDEITESQTNVVATLDTAGWCFILVPGQSTMQKILPAGSAQNTLGPWYTGYCQWLVRSDTNRCCVVGDTSYIEDSINVSVTSSQEQTWNSQCEPTLAQYCYKCPFDRAPPLITSTGESSGTLTWIAQDDRQCDMGIDSVIVEDSDNYTVSISPAILPGCYKGVVTIYATALDTMQNGLLVVRLVDCAKNESAQGDRQGAGAGDRARPDRARAGGDGRECHPHGQALEVSRESLQMKMKEFGLREGES